MSLAPFWGMGSMDLATPFFTTSLKNSQISILHDNNDELLASTVCLSPLMPPSLAVPARPNRSPLKLVYSPLYLSLSLTRHIPCRKSAKKSCVLCFLFLPQDGRAHTHTYSWARVSEFTGKFPTFCKTSHFWSTIRYFCSVIQHFNFRCF